MDVSGHDGCIKLKANSEEAGNNKTAKSNAPT